MPISPLIRLIFAGAIVSILPTPSSFAQNSSSNLVRKSFATPAVTAATNVTTTVGGTKGTIPMFTTGNNIENSTLYYNSTGLGIGRFPAGMLDVNGKAIIRGSLDLSRSGDATTSAGYPSNPFFFQSSVYNSTYKTALIPYFEIQSEPLGNNTASTGATMNFLYYSGVGSAPSETGLYVNPNGTIHFSSAQTFPIATGPQGPQGPAGGGLATVSHDSTLTGSGTSGSPLAVASSLSLTGSVTAKGVNGNNYTVNNAAVECNDYSNNGVGVEGLSYNEGTDYGGYGMVAEGYIGIYAYGSHYAGDFDGNVYVGGTLSKAGGSFKIDHPLDPENKYLSHSFVESPDMKNIYDGNVTTDANGTAVVTMPDYFEALNRDFRYQLTVMGQFAQAIVANKIANNAFTIRTDKPNVEVSWQVTGIRQDAWANAHRIPTEEAKTDQERGHFLHPELFGHPHEQSISVRNLPNNTAPLSR